MFYKNFLKNYTKNKNICYNHIEIRFGDTNVKADIRYKSI